MGKGRPPNDAEKKLWGVFARDIQKIDKNVGFLEMLDGDKPAGNKKDVPAPGEDQKSGRRHKPHRWREILPDEIILKNAAAPRDLSHDLDRKTAQKLKQGKMRPEGRVDLHGMNQDQAHRSLIGFIHRSFSHGMRCVLVITGKGQRQYHHGEEHGFWREEPGVLKRRVPEWLKDPSLSGMVLGVESARAADGGEGAVYVLLRRKRN